MKIFYKNKGAISVFLCLILLPVLLVGGLTVDASRIYMSKVVISDAGEMAMNAGLAQYNEVLHDEWGLFVMNQSPELMSDSLEAYFNMSLNGTGLPDADDYDRILDLLTESFDAINVSGSEIYRTEVEKQQILEYMKYRAPICLTELILDKIEQIKDTKKMTEAMEAEMDFSEAMEDCQDAFEAAKAELDKLNQIINSFPTPSSLETILSNAEKDYKEVMSRCFLMRGMIQCFDEKDTSKDLKDMAEKYISSVKKVDLAAPFSQNTFNSYIQSRYYMNTVEHLGGINKLLQEYDASQAEQSGEKGTDSTERKDLEKIVSVYNEQKERTAGYLTVLLSTANGVVENSYNTLNSYWTQAKTAEAQAKITYSQLEEVKKKLEKAAEKFSIWESKCETLGDKAGDMKNEIERYRKFFFDENGDGKKCMENLEILMVDVQTDQYYFGEIKDILTEEKLFGFSIATTPSTTQMNKYRAEAENSVRGAEANYASEEIIRNSYISNYAHTTISTAYIMERITDEPFYLQLQEYCKERNESNSQTQQDEANGKLNQSKEGSEEAKKEDEYPKYNWGDAGVTLPSAESVSSSEDASESLANLDIEGNVNNKRARRNIIAKFKESIRAANSFLDGVDRILADGIEGLYIAEYDMQMLSCYTSNKENGEEIPVDSVLSISGYKLSEHKAYRAEVEYILWGNQSSQKNIRNTIMMIFGIRMLFNSFFAFTDSTINGTAEMLATAIAGEMPYLIPVVKVVIKLGFAGVETADDIKKIKNGYGVTIIKNSDTWQTGVHAGDNTKGVTFDYSEYLRVFLNVNMLAGNEVAILGRTLDCIQVNEPEINLLDSYTMLSVEAKVKVRTNFMRKISDWSGGGRWGFSDDSYIIDYQSILGY